MAVFVTGASGFMGLALCEALLARGERVVGFDLLPPPEVARHAFAQLPGRFETCAGDVRDTASLTAALLDSGADRLVHLAAITAVAPHGPASACPPMWRAPRSIWPATTPASSPASI